MLLAFPLLFPLFLFVVSRCHVSIQLPPSFYPFHAWSRFWRIVFILADVAFPILAILVSPLPPFSSRSQITLIYTSWPSPFSYWAGVALNEWEDYYTCRFVEFITSFRFLRVFYLFTLFLDSIYLLLEFKIFNFGMLFIEVILMLLPFLLLYFLGDHFLLRFYVFQLFVFVDHFGTRTHHLTRPHKVVWRQRHFQRSI